VRTGIRGESVKNKGGRKGNPEEKTGLGRGGKKGVTLWISPPENLSFSESKGWASESNEIGHFETSGKVWKERLVQEGGLEKKEIKRFITTLGGALLLSRTVRKKE